MIAASSSALYDALVVLHVICAVVGFGSVAISGVYGGLAGRPDGMEEARRYFGSRGLAEWLILPVPFLGAAALAEGPHHAGFGDAWVIGGAALWLLAAFLLLRVVRPAEARIRRGDVAGGAGSLMWAGVACDVLFLLALALMVTQPG